MNFYAPWSCLCLNWVLQVYSSVVEFMPLDCMCHFTALFLLVGPFAKEFGLKNMPVFTSSD